MEQFRERGVSLDLYRDWLCIRMYDSRNDKNESKSESDVPSEAHNYFDPILFSKLFLFS